MKQKFTLENGIPVSPKRKTKYPFATMNVGNSFLAGEYTADKMTILLSSANSWKNNNGKSAWKFSARKTKDEQIRIWRIK